MSYEGYEQVICKNGHYFERDCYDHDALCPHCFAEAGWENSVDQTNGPDQGAIPMDALAQFLLEPKKTETCAHCGNTKVISQAKYRVPTRKETDPLRVYVNEDENLFLLDCDGDCRTCETWVDDENCPNS